MNKTETSMNEREEAREKADKHDCGERNCRCWNFGFDAGYAAASSAPAPRQALGGGEIETVYVPRGIFHDAEMHFDAFVDRDAAFEFARGLEEPPHNLQDVTVREFNVDFTGYTAAQTETTVLRQALANLVDAVDGEDGEWFDPDSERDARLKEAIKAARALLGETK